MVLNVGNLRSAKREFFRNCSYFRFKLREWEERKSKRNRIRVFYCSKPILANSKRCLKNKYYTGKDGSSLCFSNSRNTSSNR